MNFENEMRSLIPGLNYLLDYFLCSNMFFFFKLNESFNSNVIDSQSHLSAI